MSLVFKDGLISEMKKVSRINNFSNFSLPNISTMSDDGARRHYIIQNVFFSLKDPETRYAP